MEGSKNICFYRGPSLLTGDPVMALLTGLERPSNNPKTGPMLQTWILRADVDPSTAIKTGNDEAICGMCPLRGVNGARRPCYVNPMGPNAVWRAHERYQNRQAGDLNLSGQFIRLGAYGDPAALPFEVWQDLVSTAEGWTGYCVAPETRVLTSDLRWVMAGDVGVGDTLTAFDEHSTHYGRYWRTATVTAAAPVMRPCYAVHLQDGTTLIASGDHPWLVNKSSHYVWIRTDQLRGGYRPSRVLKLIEPWNDPVHSWDAGYLAAAFDGEGWIGNGGPSRCGHMGHLGFSQRDNAMAETVCRALDIYKNIVIYPHGPRAKWVGELHAV
jgi:hypothetical protein